jgi:hypothetical protein
MISISDYICWARRAAELLRGAECSCASDVYAFGITLWEVTARAVPYTGAPVHDVVDQVPALPALCRIGVRALLKISRRSLGCTRPMVQELCWTSP